jgi:hypothetical protein
VAGLGGSAQRCQLLDIALMMSEISLEKCSNFIDICNLHTSGPLKNKKTYVLENLLTEPLAVNLWEFRG